MGLLESGLNIALISILRDQDIYHDGMGAALHLGVLLLNGGQDFAASIGLYLEFIVYNTIDLLLSIIVVMDAMPLLLA